MKKTDIEIARAAKLQPVQAIAEGLGLGNGDLESYGSVKAKIRLETIARFQGQPDGALVLVTAMTPTAAGEGKSTTTVGLGDAFRHLGKRSIVAIREPSLGPCFGIKGGAAGGGYAQVMPMEDINLHFTGDFHAVGVLDPELVLIGVTAVHAELLAYGQPGRLHALHLPYHDGLRRHLDAHVIDAAAALRGPGLREGQIERAERGQELHVAGLDLHRRHAEEPLVERAALLEIRHRHVHVNLGCIHIYISIKL